MTTLRHLLAHRSLRAGGFSTLGACAVVLLAAYGNPDSSATVSAQAKVVIRSRARGFRIRRRR